MKKIVFLLSLVSSIVYSQSVNDLFTKANTLYKEGKYSEAIKNYQEIEKQQLVSSELYYNLGNCYYKLNKVAPTIYNYEKALLLDPLNKDAANNLLFAKRLTIDNIEELPKSFLQKFNENYVQKLSYNAWAIVAVLFSFIGSFLFLLFYFANTPSKKRFYFLTSILSFLMLILSTFITFNQYNTHKSTIEAIVFAEKAVIKNSPTLNSESVFTLHEGTKVFVIDVVDNWKKIKLADGKIGWITTSEIKEL